MSMSTRCSRAACHFFLLAAALSSSLSLVHSQPAPPPAEVAQAHYLKASNGAANASFGHAVAVAIHPRGSSQASFKKSPRATVVVGAWEEASCAVGVDGNKTGGGGACANSGAAYVFECGGGKAQCQQVAYLKASNTGNADRFGSAVAVAAATDTISFVVVGALAENSCATGVSMYDGRAPGTDNGCANAGSAYFFECDLGGTVCRQRAYLKAHNSGEGDRFGKAVAVAALSSTASLIVVGAPEEGSCATGNGGNTSTGSDNGCEQAGSAYTFVCNTTICTQQAYLKASNTDDFDFFGISVAVTARYKDPQMKSRVVVGADRENSCARGVNSNATNNGCSSSGSAYVFECDNATGCLQKAYLKPSITNPSDRFGISVAAADLSANETLIAVGAHQEDSCDSGVNGDSSDNDCLRAGSAYVFQCTTQGCTQLAYLKASNPAAYDNFGRSVAVVSDSPTEGMVVVGAPGEDGCASGVAGDAADRCGSKNHSGSAYMFFCDTVTGSCSQQTYLKASNTGLDDTFGFSVAAATELTMGQSWVVIGARWEDSDARGVDGNGTNNDAPFSGSAYVFSVLPSLATTGTTAFATSTTTGATTGAGTSATSISAFAGTDTTAFASPATTGQLASSTTGQPRTSEPSSVESSKSGDSSLLIIIGAVAGSAVLVFVAVVFAVLFRRRLSEAESVSTSFELEQREDTRVSAKEATQYQNLLRGVHIVAEIGKGHFGTVFKAERKGKVVAVKQVMEGVVEDEFMKELDVMLRLDSPRVVNLFGVCLLPDSGGLGLVMEFAELGSLDQHLRRADRRALDHRALIQISLHVAEGLSYLHSIGVLHRDLAARNVLVVSSGACKLADFGMSREVAEGETYVNTSKLPVRWAAPETLKGNVVTQASDCYSLAITMLEIFSRAELPFRGLSNLLVIQVVVEEGKRPERPKRCPRDVFKIMEQLWVSEPRDRIRASKAVSSLSKLHDETDTPQERTPQESTYASVFATLGHSPARHHDESQLEDYQWLGVEAIAGGQTPAGVGEKRYS